MPLASRPTTGGQRMPWLLIRHRVADYGRWKPVYEAHADTRRAAGLEDVHLLRDAGDPNLVVLLFKAVDEAKARAFAESDDLREAMRKAGVEGQPEMAI